MHEAWLATGDAHRSVAIGIGATARVITTAALIMIVVFASFVINPDPTVKMLAIGMAAVPEPRSDAKEGMKESQDRPADPSPAGTSGGYTEASVRSG